MPPNSRDGTTLCLMGIYGMEGQPPCLAPVPCCLPGALWHSDPCTHACSRWFSQLHVSGAAESAGCTSAARDPPEDDINQDIFFFFFLPDFGSFPALAAVPAPWEISSSDSRAAGWECFVPRSFGAVGTDVSPPMGELGRGKVLLIP